MLIFPAPRSTCFPPYSHHFKLTENVIKKKLIKIILKSIQEENQSNNKKATTTKLKHGAKSN